MRFLSVDGHGKLGMLSEWVEDNIPPYAVLSHRWGPDEITFQDIQHQSCRQMAGYAKLMFCAEQAHRDGIQYFWVDTCCIDKTNSAEISEAVNSLFRWFRYSVRCYVYLSDVNSGSTWKSQFRRTHWFTRSWTLQELLAPRDVIFFSCEGEMLGDKNSLEREIHEITRIPVLALRGWPLNEFSVGERLAWAQRRYATRAEDQAYSLFGVFDVSLPLIYGEGRDRAMKRLLQELDTARVSLAPSTEEMIYQPLKGFDFRILILNPGFKGTEITGYIQKFNLSEHPDFNAVSYTWGDEPPIYRIDINHRQVFIRPNLFHALQRMRSRTYPVFLWVDSLCINQSNEVEKNAQVQRMAKIYHRAKNVWIWLGEGDSSSDVAMDFIPRIAQNRVAWTESWWKDLSFTAFDKILEKPWFKRRLVIQEAAFSTQSLILCGDRQIDMDDFACAVSMVRMNINPRDMLPSHRNERKLPSTEDLTNFRDSPATRLLDIIKDAFERSDDGRKILRHKLSLEVLVDLATFCETKDERDAIFSLLALASDLESSTISEDLIVADYGSTTLDVFAQFVLHCCQNSGSADIICRPWAPVSMPRSFNRGRASRDYQTPELTLPSWVACRDSLPFGNPSLGSVSRLHGKPLVGSSMKRVYNAHRGSRPQVEIGILDNLNSCNGSLFIKGVFLGEIAQRSTRMAGAIITKECLDILAGDPAGRISDGGKFSESVWRTFCANRDIDGKPAPPAYRSAILQILQAGSLASSTSSRPYRVCSTSSIDVESLLETELPDTSKKALETVRDTICNRRTFHGRNYGDDSVIVGLAPQNAVVGDQICIFYGCSVPVVLREHSRDGKHFWQLIGEARGYFHGGRNVFSY